MQTQTRTKHINTRTSFNKTNTNILILYRSFNSKGIPQICIKKNRLSLFSFISRYIYFPWIFRILLINVFPKYQIYRFVNNLLLYVYKFWVSALFDNEIDTPFQQLNGMMRFPFFASGLRRRCPLCDSSVYSYCSDKLFHDSCCCHNTNNPYGKWF